MRTVLTPITIYQDGKVCRNYPANIIKRAAQKILIGFTVDTFCETSQAWESTYIQDWFIRTDRAGQYEGKQWNYYYYTNNFYKRHCTIIT